MEINEIELTFKDTELIERFYNLLINEFKTTNEIDTLDNLIYRLENKPNPDISIAKVYVNDRDELLGGILYDYYKDINVIGIQFIVINPKFKCQGIANIIYKRMISVYQYNLKFVFIEVDKGSNCKGFWEHLGFRDTKILYIRPSLDGKKLCDYLELWYKDYNGSVLQKKDIDAFIRQYEEYAIKLPKKINN